MPGHASPVGRFWLTHWVIVAINTFVPGKKLKASVLMACLMAASSLMTLSCGKKDKRPPSLPATKVFDRNVSRADVVPLVVKGSARAARVRSLYLEVEDVFLTSRKTQVEEAMKLFRPEEDSRLSEDEIRQVFGLFGDQQDESLKRYVDIQMRLREELTAEEFAKLDRVR